MRCLGRSTWGALLVVQSGQVAERRGGVGRGFAGLAGVILAAGASSRMGRDKALLPWPPALLETPSRIVQGGAGLRESHPSKTAKGGAPTSGMASTGTILSCAIQALSQVCDLVIVVAGNNEKALEPVTYGGGAFLVRNPDPERGQFSSLQTGLHDVLNRGWDNAMVTLVDRPPPSAATLNRLAGEFQKKDSWRVGDCAGVSGETWASDSDWARNDRGVSAGSGDGQCAGD